MEWLEFPQEVPHSTAKRIIQHYRSDLGLTWHHVEDLKTLQLIPEGIHTSNTHIGGSTFLDLIPTSSITFKEWILYVGIDVPSFYF